MDWSLCAICQQKSNDEVLYPCKGKKINALEVYKNFFNNVTEFHQLQALPCELAFDEECTAKTFLANNACWHKSCHQRFNNEKLKRQKRKMEKMQKPDEGENTRQSKRQAASTSIRNCCIFCREDCGTMISYSTKCAENNLRRMAENMEDAEILTQISTGDLVALDVKYHFTCLTRYRNRYRSFCRQKEYENSTNSKIARAQAFIELVSTMEDEIEDGTFTFQLNELHMTYTDRLHELGIDSLINRTVLKDKIMGYFKDLGLKEVYRKGKPTILIFPDGVRDLLEDNKLLRDFENESFLFAKVAKICREEFFSSKYHNMFLNEASDMFSVEESFAPSLNLLISMLLYGPSVKNSISPTMPVKCITKQIYFGSKKKTSLKEEATKRHRIEHEPDLPTYLGLKVHAMTRSETLVNILARFGICITYTRVLELEDRLAKSVCKQSFQEKVVCPSHLKFGLYSVAAIDNIDYNPSATTAIGSFHGTGISISQCPTVDNQGMSRQHDLIDNGNVIGLPDDYTIVPAVFFKNTGCVVPETLMKEVSGSLEKAKHEEQLWLKHAEDILESQDLIQEEKISWSAFHAARQQESIIPAITALLPLFQEKADSFSMVKHGMGIIKKTIEFLNPGQVPVMACDCPIFAAAKQLQWKFPESLGEDKFIVMFGGLHLEKGLWNALGDLLEASGWKEAITEAEITTSGSADSFLKCTHITRTRHGHQVTALTLGILQKMAYRKSGEDDFREWKMKMQKYPTYLFWDLILETELLILILIRAHREKNLDVYVESLSELMWLFFSLDHYNYSRWLSVHLRDMMSLADNIKSELAKYWVINKSGKRFSYIPIDQVHEQENCKVKGTGGFKGLTQNPQTLQRWMLAGPELTRLLQMFEDMSGISDDRNEYQHHDEGTASQKNFLKQVKQLLATISEYGNPFEDNCPELLRLNTRVCADESVVKSIKNIRNIGKGQFKAFTKAVFVKRDKVIQAPIKKNGLPLFKTPKARKTNSTKMVASLKSNVLLCSRMFIANQQRQGDLAEFFSHENQSYPPSMSDYGRLYTGTKSELLKVFEIVDHIEGKTDCAIEDGGLLLHSIHPIGPTFREYADQFVGHIRHQLSSLRRVDIVQDCYLESSIKNETRENRGKGTRVKVSASTKIPVKTNFKDFLRNSQNKEELNELLRQTVCDSTFQSTDDIYVSNGESVAHKGPGPEMIESKYEEADVRIIIHLQHALQSGYSNIKVRTSDTDVVVLLIGHFPNLNDSYPGAEVYVDFGSGKDRRLYDIRKICDKLGRRKSRALPVFHSFTGTDTTSAFRGKGKKTAWITWERFDEVTDAFLFIADNPFHPITAETSHFKILERYTVLMYYRWAELEHVNEARRWLFTKRGKSFDHIPPTQDALLQHMKRVIYTAGIWTSCRDSNTSIPSPSDWGWKIDDGDWVPEWITICEAGRNSILIKCGCTRKCSSHCSCQRADLQCTELCKCQCEV